MGRDRENSKDSPRVSKVLIVQIVWVVELHQANLTDVLEHLQETGAAKIENVEQRLLSDREVSEMTR